MSSRSIPRIKSITLQFCDFGGSSEGVRKFFQSSKFYNLVNSYKSLLFTFRLIRGSHPNIKIDYINGLSKAIPLRKDDQSEIEDKLRLACGQIGKLVSNSHHNGYRVCSFNKSIQGEWSLSTFKKEDHHEMLHFPQFPSLPIEEKLIEKGFIRKNRRTHKTHISKILRRSRNEFMNV